jgi:hypothetical protein
MHFSYASSQVHNTPEGSRENRVEVSNGKGFKEVVKRNSSGKVIHKKRKTLKASEIANIKANRFMPGLFKSCSKTSSARSNTRKTRRSNN